MQNGKLCYDTPMRFSRWDTLYLLYCGKIIRNDLKKKKKGGLMSATRTDIASVSTVPNAKRWRWRIRLKFWAELLRKENAELWELRFISNGLFWGCMWKFLCEVTSSSCCATGHVMYEVRPSFPPPILTCWISCLSVNNKVAASFTGSFSAGLLSRPERQIDGDRERERERLGRLPLVVLFRQEVWHGAQEVDAVALCKLFCPAALIQSHWAKWRPFFIFSGWNTRRRCSSCFFEEPQCLLRHSKIH